MKVSPFLQRLLFVILGQVCLMLGANAAPQTPEGTPGITLPAGTEISVRTLDRIDSKSADLHREYAATVDDAVIVDGMTIVPAQANAFLRVTQMQRSGFKRRASLSVSLIAVVVNGKRVELTTDHIESKSGSQAKKTATGAGVGAGAGAAIGAIAGGGLGAGIGAAAGGAAGTLGAVFSGKSVEIARETRFTYRLTQAVQWNQ
jgi:uncharacterized protein YcfJ